MTQQKGLLQIHYDNGTDASGPHSGQEISTAVTEAQKDPKYKNFTVTVKK